MAKITLGGTATETVGNLPQLGEQAPNFELTSSKMEVKSLSNYIGKKVLLNIFPSVDTGVCAISSKKFNEAAATIENTQVLCVSRDLPFAQSRFCAAEGIENLEMLSDYKNDDFGKSYGVAIKDGAFQSLHSRAIVVLDENHHVLYTQQVKEIGEEPNYEAALNHLQ